MKRAARGRPAEEIAAWQDDLQAAQDQADEMASKFTGANMRAVNVPPDMKMLDAEHYVMPDDPTAIQVADRFRLSANLLETDDNRLLIGTGVGLWAGGH